MLKENKWISPVRRLVGAILLIIGGITLLWIFQPWSYPYKPGPLYLELSFWSFIGLATLGALAMMIDRRHLPFNILTVGAWFFTIIFIAIAYYPATKQSASSFEWETFLQFLVLFMLWPGALFVDSVFCRWDQETATPERQEKERLMIQQGLNEEQAEQLRLLMITAPNNWPDHLKKNVAEEARYLHQSYSIEALLASNVRRNKVG